MSPLAIAHQLALCLHAAAVCAVAREAAQTASQEEQLHLGPTAAHLKDGFKGPQGFPSLFLPGE